MKKSKIVGLAVIGTLILGSIAGAVTYKTLTAIERPDFKIMMDGNELELKNANDVKIYPVTINGSTYLPLRAISNTFGKSVSWDDTTQTITLGDPQPVNLISIVEDVGGSGGGRLSGEQNLTFSDIGDVGVSYQTAIKLNSSGVYKTFKLNDSYSKLNVSILARDKESTAKTVRMVITNSDTGVDIIDKYINENEILELSDINIRGIKNLKFYVVGGTGYFLNPTVE